MIGRCMACGARYDTLDEYDRHSAECSMPDKPEHNIVEVYAPREPTTIAIPKWVRR